MELLSTPVRRKKRPNFSPEFKKQLAQRSSEPGVSVSLLAQENDINVNMLFKWRRLLREGLLDGVAHRHAMLPVTIIEDQSTDLALAVVIQPVALAVSNLAPIVLQHGSGWQLTLPAEVQITWLARLLNELA